MTSISEKRRSSRKHFYTPAESVIFFKTKEEFGGLSNMATGFPLQVNGIRIPSSEALYQACRFPHMPNVQRKIIEERSPMTAKMRSKPHRKSSRPDWDDVRVDIMRWCLKVKLAQNWEAFGKLLLDTGNCPIVEKSRKDDFWGAKVNKDGTLVGNNILGCLLMELRDQLKVKDLQSLRVVNPLSIPEFLLLEHPIETIRADEDSESSSGSMDSLTLLHASLEAHYYHTQAPPTNQLNTQNQTDIKKNRTVKKKHLGTRSKDIDAVLLMTTILSHSKDNDIKPLSVNEWGQFAKWLNSKELTPGHLMNGSIGNLLQGWHNELITVERLESLLARETALTSYWEKWEKARLWVMIRSDPDYPSGLKRHLKQDSPAILFGCGNKSLLNKEGLAVVGSRNVKAEDLAYSALLGSLAAQYDYSIVSGGASEVDEATMFGALLSGGKAIGVLANGLMRACSSEKYRNHLMDDRLVLISPYNPEATFDKRNAMQRNKYIYCLSNAAFVVHSIKGEGGTWHGAMENLKKHWVQLCVRQNSDPAAGNTHLEKLGATWAARMICELDFPGLFTKSDTQNLKIDSYETFLEKIQTLCSDTPCSLRKLNEQIPISKAQLDKLLEQAVSEEKIKRLNNPIRYQWINPEFANYETFLEKIQTLCSDTPCSLRKLNEQIPISKAQLDKLLEQAVSEEKIKRLNGQTKYIRFISTQHKLPLLDK